MGGEIAWVFDDSRILTLNIREGTRAKVWAEYYLDRDGRSFGTMGLDARKYIRLFSKQYLSSESGGRLFNWGEQASTYC